MKKKLKLSMIIIGGLVAAVAVCALILGLIPINPIKRLPENYRIDVYDTSGVLAANDETRALLDEGVKANKFSVLHALLEYKYSYGFKFKTFKNDDGDKERYKYYAKDIDNVKATESAYMLVFHYDAPVTIKVQGEELRFDRVKMLVKDMSGEIERVDMVFYLQSEIEGEPINEYYYTTPVTVHMATSKLYDKLGEIKESL